MRREKRETSHVIDSFFVFMLFSIFAICAILLIAFGANIYKKTISNLEEHFNVTTSMAYIEEKFRQSDISDAFSVTEFGDGNALMIKSVVNETNYITYIYKYDDHLKELHMKADNTLSPNAGQNLLEIKYFRVDDNNDGSFTFTITDINQNSLTVTCYSRCD